MTLKEIAIELFKVPQFSNIAIEDNCIPLYCDDVLYTIHYYHGWDKPFFLYMQNKDKKSVDNFEFKTLKETIDFILL